MKRRALLFAVLFAGLGLAGVALAPASSLPGRQRAALLRTAFVGAPLMQVQTPDAELELTVGAVDLMVAFVGGPRVAVETFQCLLNDQDVTAVLTLGRNGAVGSLVGLHEGENHIVVRVFGKSGGRRLRGGAARARRARQTDPFIDVACQRPPCLTRHDVTLACAAFANRAPSTRYSVGFQPGRFSAWDE
jgi:hypothetical protein